MLEGPTTCLERLHVHVSRLAAGAGNAPHSHSYETAMVVLEGEIETLGQRVQRHGLVFYSGGTLHGIRNPTSEPARYVVFEFHGRLPFWRKIIDPHWWGHKLHAAWNRG
jgi:quercetin dioxygenase-like cupin family protein